MTTQRRASSRRRLFVLAVSAAISAAFAISAEAQVQVDDNLQDRLANYNKDGLFSGQPSTAQNLLYNVCKSPGDLIDYLYHTAKRNRIRLDDAPEAAKKNPRDFFAKPENRRLGTQLIRKYFVDNPPIAKARWQDLQAFLTDYLGLPKQKGVGEKIAAEIKALQPYTLNFCTSNATTLKVKFPLNPTYETNVLKSNQNNSPGTSAGFGGSVEIVAPGLRKLDLVGMSAQTQSVRYGQFSSKNFDAITAQAAYQFFIDAYALELDGSHRPMSGDTPPERLAPANMITVDTVAIGFQNQLTYLPLFNIEQVNLFTPQVSFNHTNMPLFGGGQCSLAIPDPSRNGYCYYADISVTLGQTFADVGAQENANLTVAMTPGWRVDNTDWTVTLPATVTARDYQNVVGGRRDVLWQIGPTVAYAPPTFVDTAFITSVTFKLSATYNQNYSTVAKNSWHGIIVMPTLTLAFSP
jgi:hypothetical protein